jgi:hypothetical protein
VLGTDAPRGVHCCYWAVRTSTPGTSAKVDQLHLVLRREFPDAETGHVHELMCHSVDVLLAGAHFDDFVPLLAYRRVRERIRAESGPASLRPSARARRAPADRPDRTLCRS